LRFRFDTESGAQDYLSHLPIGTRRDAMKAWIDTSASGDAQAYEQRYRAAM
jgi:hypothetical protein